MRRPTGSQWPWMTPPIVAVCKFSANASEFTATACARDRGIRKPHLPRTTSSAPCGGALFANAMVRCVLIKRALFIWVPGIARQTQRSHTPTPSVVAARDRLHMGWVYAMPNATKVVDHQSFGDWADEPFIGKPMHGRRFAVHHDLPIAFRRQPACPKPTPVCLLNSTPKTWNRIAYCHAHTKNYTPSELN